MAYYRASQVIKMRRNALGHSREEYSGDGPSHQTVYRMENGMGHVKEKTYRSLSRAMGEEESTKQGILHTDDIQMLWLTNEISDCILCENYERAEELIQQLESKLDVSVKKNRQYLYYIKADMLYYQGFMETKKYKEIIEESLQYGNMMLEELLKRKWPFEERECNRLLSLVEVVRKDKKYDKQKEVLEQLLAILENGYMNSEYSEVYKIVARYRLGDVLGNLELHREAIELDKETVILCEEQQDWRFVPELYYDIYWNYMMLSKKETLTQQEEIYRKECLLKAYYLDKASLFTNILYEKEVLKLYPEEVQ